MASMINEQNAPHDGIVENRRTPPPWYFSVLFYGLIVWGIGYSAYYLLSGWSSTAEYGQKRAAFQQQYQPAASGQ